jgi:hypothetical protein
MQVPRYDTPEGTVCTSCGEPCKVVALRNEFDFAGTHCTHGRGGTHYPEGWGSPVSDCCGEDTEIFYGDEE